MVSLAVGHHPRFAASDIELTAPGPSYTAVTLRTFQTWGSTPCRTFFIIGTDAFAEIATWHDYPAVLDLAHFVVIARQGQSVDHLRARLPDLADRMALALGPSHANASSTGIHLLQVQTPAVSSTAIRLRIAAGEPIADMVPAEVERPHPLTSKTRRYFSDVLKRVARHAKRRPDAPCHFRLGDVVPCRGY